MKTIRAYQCVRCGKVASSEIEWIEMYVSLERVTGYKKVEIHDDNRYSDGQPFCSFDCAAEWVRNLKDVPVPVEKPAAPAEDLVSVLKDIAADAAKPEVAF